LKKRRKDKWIYLGTIVPGCGCRSCRALRAMHREFKKK
jgi:hypothetical protein